MLNQLPNALTLSRLLLAPVVAYAVWRSWMLPAAADSFPGGYPALQAHAQQWAIAAAGLFVFAALTDLFDGMAARALKVNSKLGRLLDPIADKALVGLPLIALSLVAKASNWPLWPFIAGATAIIVVRDLLITLLRLASGDGEGMRVSRLAKWKTAFELCAVALPLLLLAATFLLPGFSMGPNVNILWVGMLSAAAILSAFTGLQYVFGSGRR